MNLIDKYIGNIGIEQTTNKNKKEWSKKYYLKNKKKQLKYQVKWRAKNKKYARKRDLEYQRKWRNTNRKHVNEVQKECRKSYLLKKPYAKTLQSICSRTTNKSHHYYKKGINNYLTLENMAFLWRRDRAYNMSCPEIHRKNNDGDYTVRNCMFVEKSEHVKLRRKDGSF
jgi:hypothetical protein